MVRLSERDFLMMVREAILLLLDAIERKMEIHPRTSTLRKEAKRLL